MAEEEVIQFTGVKELRESEQESVNKLSTEYYQKIKMLAKNLTSLSVHIKTIEKGGKKRQFDIKIKMISPTHMIEANNEKDQDNWDLSRSLHKTFNSILSEMEHKMRVHDQVTRFKHQKVSPKEIRLQ